MKKIPFLLFIVIINQMISGQITGPNVVSYSGSTYTSSYPIDWRNNISSKLVVVSVASDNKSAIIKAVSDGETGIIQSPPGSPVSIRKLWAGRPIL